MNTNIYSIYDTAAAMYKNLWEVQTDAQACREFGDIFDADNPISKHPEHYYLCRLGSFNNDTGKIVPGEVTTLLTGLEALAMKNKLSSQQEDLFPQSEKDGRKLNSDNWQDGISPGGTD